MFEPCAQAKENPTENLIKCYNLNENFFFWSLTGRYGKAGRVCRGGVSSYWNIKFTKRSYTRGFNYQFLSIVTRCKRLKNWNGVYKAREWKDPEGSRRAESDPNWKVSN